MTVLVDELGETSRSVKVFESHSLPIVDCSSVWVILIMFFNETSHDFPTICDSLKIVCKKNISYTFSLFKYLWRKQTIDRRNRKAK